MTDDRAEPLYRCLNCGHHFTVQQLREYDMPLDVDPQICPFCDPDTWSVDEKTVTA